MEHLLRAFKSFVFWLILIGICSLLLLAIMTDVLVKWGFTIEEGFFLSFMLTLPAALSIATLYKKAVKKATFSALFLLNPAVIKKWEAVFLLTLVALFTTLKVHKYMQINDPIKALTIIVLVILPTYLSAILVQANIYSGYPSQGSGSESRSDPG